MKNKVKIDTNLKFSGVLTLTSSRSDKTGEILFKTHCISFADILR